MAHEYCLEPPVSAPVRGKWRLVAPRARKQRDCLQVTVELWNGTLKHEVWQATASDREPLSCPASKATGFGIPPEALRQASDTLTDRVRRALLTAAAVLRPGPSPEQTATKLTADAIADASEVAPHDVVDKETLLKELATLDAIAYDQRRDETAQLLGVRVNTLDKEVAAQRAQPAERDGTGTPVLFTDPEPWPEAVDGASLLDDLAALYTRYVVLPRGAADMLALWTLHTYTHAAASTTPRVGIESPQKRCGKTTLLAIIRATVARPLPASNITTAALFRAIEKWQPTMLIDEADTFLPANDELRGVLNAGHTRSQAYVIRTVGEDHEPRAFCVWAPVAIALIGKLPSTLADRAIVVKMRRKLPSEQVERFRMDRLENIEQLRRRCLRWAQDTLATLRTTDPTMPEGLHDRAADNWRPLCAIAAEAGGEWPQRAVQAIKALTPQELEDETAGVMLLEDMRQLFTERATDKLPSTEIVAALHKLEERPWSEWGRQEKPITARQIARLLAPFDIKPKSIRIGPDTPKGYEQNDFVDAWARYLSLRSATPPQPSNDVGLQDPASATASNGADVADADGCNPACQADRGGVADLHANTGANTTSSTPACNNGCGGVADDSRGMWRTDI
jgi:putative DNA primase/helicase